MLGLDPSIQSPPTRAEVAGLAQTPVAGKHLDPRVKPEDDAQSGVRSGNEPAEQPSGSDVVSI